MISGERAGDGFALGRAALAPALVAGCAARIDTAYQSLDAARRAGGAGAINRLVAAGERFVPTASSLTLGAVFATAELRVLLDGIVAGPAGAWIRSELPTGLAGDLDQAWVRRQYAPAHYPPLHAPHSWHQDGALGFDFPAHADGNFPPNAVLPMVTCWIALTSCGDQAPGLELVTQRFEGLLAPAELAEARVRPRFVAEEFWRPLMQAGDALLFRGDILHRTHVTPAMTRDRTSIELRFFAADNLPARLGADRFLALK